VTDSARERFGVHRVIEPAGGLPQPAWRLDPYAPLRPTEVALAVRRVSLDAWSFRQLWQEAEGDEDGFRQRFRSMVRERGKAHNPATDSGGTLLGTVAEMGERAAEERRLAVGERVVPHVSSSAVPLRVDRVLGVFPRAAQLEVEGRAIVPLAYPVGRAPADLDESLVVASADVAGAPGLVHDLARPGQLVAVLGANGFAGLLACAAALERGCRVVGVDVDVRALVATGVAEPLEADATDALAVLDGLGRIGASGADLVVHAAAAAGCEAAACAAVAVEGTVLLFSLATSFQRCVNVADVFGKRPRMLVANALALHHADSAYELLRRYPGVRRELQGRVALR
jgi:L-erythro-3,5-diaminohexanoate dehydrogenase